MSIYPVAQALIAPDWTRDPPITPRLLIFHTAVSNALAPGPSAPDANGLEWHFYIAENGEIVQRRDTGEEADANYHANSFLIDGTRYGAISVETWDGGDPEANPWTDPQVTSIVHLCHLANGLDAIALQRPDAWNGAGVGYHRQFPEWDNPYHSCPGDTRAAQFDNTIWPLVTQGDDDMTPEQATQLKEAHDAAQNAASIASEVRNSLNDPDNGVLRRLNDLAAQSSPDKLAAAIAPKIPGVSEDVIKQALKDALHEGV